MITFQTFLLIALALVGAVGVIIYILTSQIKSLKTELKGDENSVLMEWLKEMKGSVDKNSQVIESQLKDQRSTLEEQLKNQRMAINEQTKQVGDRLQGAYDVINLMQKQIGGIQEFGTDIKDLSNILKSPKLRGGLGEQFLYEIIANTLPSEMYKTQYKFKDGNICDAVVFIEKGIIPIDSKFPMENFKAMVVAETQPERDKFKKVFIGDVKKRIDEISSKYILPEEGTTDQALMYIPSENVYYELIVNTPEIEDYARRKSVVMVSPNTISYFLKVMLVAYQQHELQKHAGEILKALAGIGLEANKFNDELSVLERHISNSFNAMGNVKAKYIKLTTKIEGVQALGGDDTQKKLLE